MYANICIGGRFWKPFKCVELTRKDLIYVAEATSRMSEVTHGINEYIREHENFQKMLLIQNSLTGTAPKIIVPGRKFIREGTLMKVLVGLNSMSLFYAWLCMCIMCNLL